MKKILMMAVALTCIVSAANAQNWKAEIGVGASKYGGDADGNFMFSYQLGAGYEFNIVEDFSIIPYAYLIKKGSKGNGSFKSNANYLEVPVMAAYRFDAGNGFSLLPQAGVYLAYGLWGKTKEGGPKIETFSNSALKSRDFGVAFKLEGEYERYTAGLRFDLGLADVGRSPVGAIKNRTLMVSFGYRF